MRNPSLLDGFGFSSFFVLVLLLGKQRLLTAGPHCMTSERPVQSLVDLSS